MKISGNYTVVVKPADPPAAPAVPPVPPLVMTPQGGNLPDEKVGAAVGGDGDVVCLIKGGKPPFRLGVSQGTFPAGMDLGTVDNGDGTFSITIAGTPQASGAFSFTLDVLDADEPAGTGAAASSPAPAAQQ